VFATLSSGPSAAAIDEEKRGRGDAAIPFIYWFNRRESPVCFKHGELREEVTRMQDNGRESGAPITFWFTLRRCSSTTVP
jgi:hypothetical protein